MFALSPFPSSWQFPICLESTDLGYWFLSPTLFPMLYLDFIQSSFILKHVEDPCVAQQLHFPEFHILHLLCFPCFSPVSKSHTTFSSIFLIFIYSDLLWSSLSCDTTTYICQLALCQIYVQNNREICPFPYQEQISRVGEISK